MLKQPALKALEFAINQYLKLDPELEHLLQPLQEKSIAIQIRYTPVMFLFSFKPNSVCLSEAPNVTPDAHIEGSLFDFIQLHFSQAPSSAMFESDLNLNGDTEVASHFSDLFARLDIDWENHLAQIIGDYGAHAVGSFLRNAVSFGQQSSKAFQHNLRDYLQEEVRGFPPREEVEDFMNDIDQLSQDVERLVQHIALGQK